MSRPLRALVCALLAALIAPAASGAATAKPSGAGCDRLDDAACLLPFPSDAFTRADRSTETGLRLALRTSQMPRNAKGKPIDPGPINAVADGFSPGSVLLARVPGLDTPAALKRTAPAGLSDLTKYTDKNAPVVVLDAATGKRWPIWAELDSTAGKNASRLLEIHPARNFLEGHRYVVVLRNLKRSSGAAIRAGKRFAALRDGKRPGRRYERIFRTLKRAGIARDRSLFLTWDFTVASSRSLAGRMLAIRDAAFAQLGDKNLADGKIAGTAPSATLAPMALTGDDAKYAGRFAQILQGTITVPCFLDKAGCPPGASFKLSAKGVPAQNGTVQASVICVVPDTATPDNPARLIMYGHGLLGSNREVMTAPDKPVLAREANAVLCATPWAGMSSEDIPNAISVLGDFSGMKTIADRLQQGMLNALYLGRYMSHPQGLAASPLLQVGGRPIIRTGELYYDGNSQGGIMGGALTPFAPDYTRAVLGVPGMNYSTLLPRSVDFDTYSKVLYPAYPDELERPLVLDLAQLLWDRGEANGYAQHMTGDPLPNTPEHTVLLQVAFGDHQVTQYQADVEARTIGARIHTPALAPGRSPQAKPSALLQSMPSGWTGSGIVYWDSGPGVVPPPPLTNTPNRGGADPHEHPRRTPAARAQKVAFLQPGGTIVDTCAGGPCVAGSDVG